MKSVMEDKGNFGISEKRRLEGGVEAKAEGKKGGDKVDPVLVAGVLVALTFSITVLTVCYLFVTKRLRTLSMKAKQEEDEKKLVGYKTNTTEIEANSEFKFEQTDCCICLLELSTNDSLRKINICEHVFHSKCLQEYFIAG